MCGVLLIYSKKKKLIRSNCIKAFRSINNRGPDKQLSNFFLSDRLFIGNSVLHINGKLKKGNELYNKNGVHLAYNGEIYNHKELDKKYFDKKQSNDTVTLLKLFTKYQRQQVLKKLDGMYSLIVFDEKNKETYFATDPQGEKRILKYEDEDFLILSSTTRPIIDFIKKKIPINPLKINDYFNTRHFMQFTSTILEGVNYIKGGTIYSKKLPKQKIIMKKIINPVDWINEKEYKKNTLKNSSELSLILENKIVETLNIMKPDIKFGTIMSGGIDSSIISSILDKDKMHNTHFCLTYHNKDRPAQNLKKKGYINYINYKKLKIIDMNVKMYFKNLKVAFNQFNSLLSTHDLPGRCLTYSYFKRKGIKVIFGGDGADEIFGGYVNYLKVFNRKNFNKKIVTRYSINKNIKSVEFFAIQKLFNEAYTKYRTFLNRKEAIIQSNLFIDYFAQSVSVHNVSNDILGGENSIEMRSLFLNKNIIKFALNLPIENKINLNATTKELKLKPLLKKIFIRRFSSSLIEKKQGFSGFPSEVWNFLEFNEKTKIKKFISKHFFIKLKKLDEALKWKLLNTYFYFKLKNFKI